MKFNAKEAIERGITWLELYVLADLRGMASTSSEREQRAVIYKDVVTNKRKHRRLVRWRKWKGRPVKRLRQAEARKTVADELNDFKLAVKFLVDHSDNPKLK